MIIAIPINKAEANIPDAPNLMELKDLTVGSSVFFGGIDWWVYKAGTTPLLMSKQDITAYGINFNRTNHLVGDILNRRSILENINTSLLKTFNSDEVSMLLNNNLEGSSYKIGLPTSQDLVSTSWLSLYSRPYDNPALKVGIDDFGFQHLATNDIATNDCIITTTINNNFYIKNVQDGHRIFTNVADTHPSTVLYPSIKLPGNTKILKSNVIGATNNYLVLGGSYKLSSPNGVTNKFYYYDRYLTDPNFSFYRSEEIQYTQRESGMPTTNDNYKFDMKTGFSLIKSINNNGYAYYSTTNRNNELIRYDRFFASSSYRAFVTRKLASAPSLIRGSVEGSYFLGKDNQYPINGAHTDGYWYVKKEEAIIEGLGEVTIDSISQDLKHDIMPLITVGVNENFERIVQGRGYISNPISVTRADGKVNISAITTSGVKSGIKVTGKFTTIGPKYIKEKDNTGKEIYLLFEVINPSVSGSATAVSF